MGLDMYAWTVPANATNLVVDYSPEETIEKTELAYWRKFNHLHGWMELLYRHKEGKGKVFNCDSVRLENEDLTALELALSQNQLTPAIGFFFGSEEINPEDVTSTHKFILDARAAIKDGKAVFYDSWW